ncbi:hypothetical protein SAMN02746089_00302 [Caldanaerobius fijiensis DSM 17918]|uniref:DUF6385 domain-containing protein n=1 Tax=Caldanaerobius fijiensis DSM 17918 TaxID=1121256 RepID=A0A1M4TUB3_9THEO|nr:DUF6385 domain-containing protein [Caldanaerobius fijiensis]SHE47984.1 hypothetical protein SAMN02746089_00302 [Caldanaerobius fijiensis DSM 17918]
MPNNIVFNPVADQLKSLVHGRTAGGTVTALLTDASGNLQTMLQNASVTVAATNFNIRSLSYTTDTVSVQSIVETVNTNVTNTVNIRSLSPATDTVSNILSGRVFTSATTSINNVTGTGILLLEDTSQKRMYTYYVYNTGAAAISVKLQISPTTADAYFIDDLSGEVSVVPGSATTLVAQRFLNYTRLYYNAGTATVTAVFYYNAQT